MNTDSKDRKPWRLFCAFELPDSLRARIHDHIQRLREAVPEAAASWSRPENIHLTVKFFGSVDPQKAQVIDAVAARVIQAFQTFATVVGGTGVFPRPSRPQVLWIGISDPSGQLSSLQQRLESELASEGFPKEDRAFRPHLTIARIRKPQNANRLAQTHLRVEFSNVEITLQELVLFRSELSSQGSKYTAISRHRLSGASFLGPQASRLH